MDMISLRRSIPRDTSIRSSGRSIVTTAGFGGFGRTRTTKSVASCTSLAALNTHAGFSSTIPVGMTTMKPATSSVNMRFCLDQRKGRQAPNVSRHQRQSYPAVDGPGQIVRTGNQGVILDRRQRQIALPQQGTGRLTVGTNDSVWVK